MKLSVRKFRESDLESLYGLLSDPRVMEHLESPFTREESRRFLEKAGLSEPPLIYAAEDAGVLIGYVIYHAFDADSMEIGWVLRPEYQGKGCASALTGMLVEKAISSGKQAVIECSPEQAASRHIAEKFHFEYEGRFEGLDVFRLRP